MVQPKTWAARAVASIAAGALLVGMSVSASHAAPRLEFDVKVSSDGTPDWDGDDEAGNDSGPNNQVVRVNDTIAYGLTYAVNEEPGENTTIKLTLPKGLSLDAVPGYCGAGSSLTPENVGTPSLPLSATSIDELPEQTLVCNMGRKENASETISLVARVSNLVHHGQDLTPTLAELSVDGAPPVVDDTPPTVTASSRLRWDISKNGIAQREDSGYRYGPSNSPCPWDTTVVCKQTSYNALIFAPAGGKGAMPAVGDITFVDDLSPEALYPQLPADKIAQMKANLDKYGSRITMTPLNYQAPGSKIGLTENGIKLTEVNAVRDSGKTTLSQPGGPGTPVTFTISGADMTLLTYPKQAARPAGSALPGANAYAVSIGFNVWTPVSTIVDFGVESNSTWTLPTRNAYTSLTMNGFTPADKQTIADQPAWNDYRTTTPNVTIGDGFSKGFTGVPGAEGNMSPLEFAVNDRADGEGPPGGAVFRSGGITVAPTQTVLSQMQIFGSNPALPAPVSFIACDSWDASRLHLRTIDAPASTDIGAWRQHVPSEGKAVWVSGYNNVLRNGQATAATASDQTPDITVQYSALPGGAGEAGQCGDAQGPWFDDPADVPGNDPAKAAEGVYTGVARVRVHGVLPAPVANSAFVGNGVRAGISVALQVADGGREAGDILPNWASHKRINLKEATMEEVLADSGRWSPTNYNPTRHTGSPGDRLILADAQVRVNKQVRKGTSGAFSSTPPNVAGGDVVQYQITPSLTSGAATPGILKDVWVEDCLPASQTYADASLAPKVVSIGSTPDDAKRAACAAGETYIRWVWPHHEVNKAIAPIVLSVEVSPTAKDGVYTNTVVVWAQDDASTLQQRSSKAEVQVANIAGVKLEKVALTPVTQVNRDEQDTDEHNRWLVRLTNTLPPSEASRVSDPDVIDVLPKQAVRGTSFTGRFEFVSAKVTQGGDRVRILYTSAANVNLDPADESNGADGATTWCDAPAGGAVVSGTGDCPALAAEVTALRVQRPGPYATGEVIEFELSSVGIDNAAGDTYANTAFARAKGLQFPVGPTTRVERVVGGELGNYAWLDLNRNGLQDDFNSAPEPAAAGVKVTLKGTDDLGNAVSRETTTNGDGAYLFDGLRASDGAGYTVTFDSYASGFTTKGDGAQEPEKDSNADTSSGAAEPVKIEAGASDTTIDAGYLASGTLNVTKLVEGEGVNPLASGNRFTFQVSCTLDGAKVVDKELSLTLANGDTSATTDKIDDIPVGAVCVVKETEAGNSDPVDDLPSATVTIGWDEQKRNGQDVTVSLTNYYSAGVLEIVKKLDGDEAAIEAAKDKTFTFDVTCQMPGAPGAAPSTVYSGSVSVTGAGKVPVTDASGNPVKLALGARCFAVETADGGANSSSVDKDGYDNAAIVETGSPDQLAQLTITGTNTFLNPPKVSLDKELVGVDETPGQARATYTITVTNSGSVATTYDLSDTFRFGEGITPTQARVVRAEPAGIAANAGFDGASNPQIVTGQEIAAGATHTYTIEASAEVAAGAAADCSLEADENGTALLNQATLVWDGNTEKDEACGQVTPPPPPSDPPTPTPAPTPSDPPATTPAPTPSTPAEPTPSVKPRPGLPKTGGEAEMGLWVLGAVAAVATAAAAVVRIRRQRRG